MKIIDIYIIKSRPVKELTPSAYYRKMRLAYAAELERKNRCSFWGMGTACDNTAREMCAHIAKRRSNITELVTTKEEADQLFECFKIFANVWAYQVTGGADRKTSEKERQIKRITDILHAANTEQLERLDAFIRTYVR